MPGDRERLQQELGYEFTDPALLELALTHRSCGSTNNERLEFLGDSILNHCVAEALFQQFTNATEGELSRMRAALVKGETLAEVARELALGDALRLGSGELKSGGQRRDSILADTLEAIIGAVLLDADVSAARDLVLRLFDARLAAVSPQAAPKDAKTSLQEYLQGRGLPLPDYQLAAVAGEDHRQQFTVVCSLSKPVLQRDATGHSRRKAEQAAAAAVLEVLGE
ncbi:MAG: ribonuclease III [Halieaceae bacterium]